MQYYGIMMLMMIILKVIMFILTYGITFLNNPDNSTTYKTEDGV